MIRKRGFKETETGRIPAEWKLLTVEESTESIIDYRGKTPKKTCFGIPLITAKIVKNGRIAEPNEFIAENDYDTWMRRGIPKSGDVIITTEAPLGEVAQLNDRKIALAQRLIALRGKKGLLSNNFLRFVLQSPLVQNELRKRESGTTVVGIKQRELRKVLLPIPPYAEQEKISKILLCIDDKIELNRQMNTTLEQIGQAIFKHWFVDFEFPNEDDKPYRSSGGEMVDSELGVVPEGWGVGKIRDSGQVICGKTPPKSRKEYFGGDFHFIKIPDMHGEVFIVKTEDSLTEEGKKFQDNKTIPANSICASCIATVGLVSITDRDSQTNQQINSIVPDKKFYTYYLYYDLSSMKELLQLLGSGGSATLNLNTTQFSNIAIVYPADDVLQKFYGRVDPIFRRIKNNLHQCQSIAQIRDILLPKLMSGEIRVATNGVLNTEDIIGEYV